MTSIDLDNDIQLKLQGDDIAVGNVIRNHLAVNPWLVSVLHGVTKKYVDLYSALEFSFKLHGFQADYSSEYMVWFDRLDVPSTQVVQDQIVPITTLQVMIWSLMSHVHEAFDLTTNNGRRGFIWWYLTFGQKNVFRSRRFDELLNQRDSWPDGTVVPLAYNWILALHPFFVGQDKNGRTASSLDAYYENYKITDHLFIPQREGLEVSVLESEQSMAQQLCGGVQVVGFATSELGLGEDARTTALSLVASQILVGVQNLDHGGALPAADDRVKGLLSTDVRFDKVIFNLPASESYKYSLKKSSNCAAYRIGYWPWELEKFPRSLKFAFDVVDEVWAPSKFVYDSLISCSNRPIIHMPLAVDIPWSITSKRNVFSLEPNKFYFMFMFDAFSYIHRKNPYAVIEAFRKAFPKEHDVGLVIKAMNGKGDDPLFSKLNDMLREDARLKLINKVLDRVGVLELMASCDAFVSLHRSEGFGRCIAEAMLLGRPVVVTGYSGNMDFTTNENSYLVSYDLITVKDGQYPYSSGARWADPNTDDAADKMRLIYENKEQAEQRGRLGQRTIVEGHSLTVCGARYARRLEQIEKIMNGR